MEIFHAVPKSHAGVDEYNMIIFIGLIYSKSNVWVVQISNMYLDSILEAVRQFET